jgi:dipeptidyl aminopeptidase/acylaminoacyl peptidase
MVLRHHATHNAGSMEATPKLTAEMIADQRWPRELHLAPDGRRLVYAAVALSKANEHAETALWVVDAGGANARQLTTGTHDDRAPQWSPVGRQVAFLRDRQKRGVARLYCIAMDGSKAQPMLDRDASEPAERGISAFAWSPDGGHIAYVCADSPPPMTTRARTAATTRLCGANGSRTVACAF